MALLTSYFVKKEKQSYDIKDAFISISKGRCLHDCPVYDRHGYSRILVYV